MLQADSQPESQQPAAIPGTRRQVTLVERVAQQASNALTDAGIKHGVLGGVAGNIHGSKRSTNDVDIDVDNLRKKFLKLLRKRNMKVKIYPKRGKQPQIRQWRLIISIPDEAPIKIDLVVKKGITVEETMKVHLSEDPTDQGVIVVTPSCFLITKCLCLVDPGRVPAKKVHDVEDIIFGMTKLRSGDNEQTIPEDLWRELLTESDWKTVWEQLEEGVEEDELIGLKEGFRALGLPSPPDSDE